jgi:hypothetical protein
MSNFTVSSMFEQLRSLSADYKGYQPACVWVIFQLPPFCHKVCPEPLAFVELFKPFDLNIEEQHHLPTTCPTRQHSICTTSIVPIQLIHASCQLVPNYKLLNCQLQISAASDLLSITPRFFLNQHSSYFLFVVMDHWQQMMQQPHTATSECKVLLTPYGILSSFVPSDWYPTGICSTVILDHQMCLRLLALYSMLRYAVIPLTNHSYLIHLMLNSIASFSSHMSSCLASASPYGTQTCVILPIPMKSYLCQYT